MSITLEQRGTSCIVTIHNTPHTIPQCDALKLAATLWDKPGEHYTQSEMDTFGFSLKR